MHVHLGNRVLNVSHGTGWRWPERFHESAFGAAWWVGPWRVSIAFLDKLPPGLFRDDELSKCCRRRIMRGKNC